MNAPDTFQFPRVDLEFTSFTRECTCKPQGQKIPRKLLEIIFCRFSVKTIKLLKGNAHKSKLDYSKRKENPSESNLNTTC